MIDCYLFLRVYFLCFFISGAILKERNFQIVAVDARSKAENSTAPIVRRKRQISSGHSDLYLSTPTCITRTGVFGRCLTFDQCYPQSEASPASYAFYNSLQDVCYLAKSSELEYGICCGNFQRYNFISDFSYPSYYPSYIPQTPVSDSSQSNHGGIANWPPAIPTHPPNHTPATHPPVQWPPPIPTHATRPPATATTTSRPWTMWTKPTTKPTYRPTVTVPARPTIPRPSLPPPTTATTARPTTPPKPIVTYPATPNPPKPAVIVTRPTPPPTNRPTPTYPTDESSVYLACGISNFREDQKRIVGGQDSELNEWPWMAGILTSGRLFCGGSLIDSEHVLTAAHCIAHMNSWQVAALRVHLGDHNIKSYGETAHIERRVKFAIRHRKFNPQTLYNDIALLKLDSPVQFSKNVRPVCLPQGRSAYLGNMATVVGWGSLREMGPAPGVLQEVNIPIWSNSDCRSKYGPAAPGGIIDEFICAGRDSKDSCSGDSGGPLMVSEGDKWIQIGIVSWGIGCGKGQYPGVYTRVTSYMPWVQENKKL